MPEPIDAFPQRRAGKRKGKPTIAEIMNDGARTGQSPEAIFATIGTLHPEMPLADVQAAFRAEIERQKAEAAKNQTEIDCLTEILAVVESICAEPGHEDLGNGQALWLAAQRGNEQAVAFWYNLDAAVTFDPDWSVSEEGVAVCRKGAAYNTPEKLVAAYRAGRLDDPRPIENVIAEICLQACRTCGVDPDVVDVNTMARRRVVEVSSRITDTHPRRKDIEEFFVEQAMREEILRQCRERGIPVEDDEDPADE
jgi:hypothetical protein